MGNRTFSSEEDAREYSLETLNGLMDGVRITNNPLGGRLLVSIPTEEEFLRVIQDNFKDNSWTLKSTHPYLAESTRTIQIFYFEAIKKRKLFNEAQLVNSTENYSSNEHDWFLEAEIRSNNVIFWFISPGDEPNNRAPWFPAEASSVNESIDNLRAIICSEFSHSNC